MASEIVTNQAVLNGDDVHLNGDGVVPPNGVIDGTGDEQSSGPSTSTETTLPKYEDMFPALPGGLGGPGSSTLNIGGGSSIGGIGLSVAARLGANRSAAGNASNNQAPKLRRSNVTKIYRVAPEERRAISRNRFGEQSELSKICSDIMAKTSTDIQLTNLKDGTLNFLISGKEEATDKARHLLSAEFQTQIVHQLAIPKEHHRIILGKNGKKLLDLEQATGTRIQIPKQDDPSENIRIMGMRESIDKAVHEIISISDQALSRHIERLIVPKIYHPFIVGPFGRTLDEINKETGAKVNVPPQSVQKDELSITGERNAVLRAKERVLAIYDEKKRRTQTVSIEVKKPQHKYIVGPKGHTLNEIFEITGVSVEMPSPDSTLETIVLRGEPDKLANALSVLYAKAHSETGEEIDVPGWVQRHILGPKGTKFQELSLQFPKVNVSFEFDEHKIKMLGPVADVRLASDILKKRSEEIMAQFSIVELPISDQKHIRSLIVGKNGVNLKQIREETKASIQVIGEVNPPEREGSSNQRSNSNGQSKSNTASDGSPLFIRIEGTHSAVKKAKTELESLLKKLESEVQMDLVIERRFYGEIIGAKGANIRDIRSKFNEVQITFPEQFASSEKVTIRGEKKDVDECYKYLNKLNKDLLANNYRVEVPILKQLIGFLQGKDSLKNIREETGARIDLPSGDSDVITITGPKENVEKARERIQAVQSSLDDMATVDIIIPSKIHNYMLGSKGRNIKQIMSECGGVLVNFPPEGSGSDKVNVRGPKDCVAKAKKLLVAMSNDYQTNNYSEELKVRVEHHSYLIGKNGSMINKLREQTGVRVYFASDNPNSNSSRNNDQELVTITGKKENVQKARAILEEKIKELDKTIESEIRIDPKYHSLFVSRRAAVCKQLYDEYGGVNVSFPHHSDKENDRIMLKGSSECVEAVKKRIAEIIADFDAQVTESVEIDSIHHRQLLGPRGRVNAIQSEFGVRIKFPQRPPKVDNGDANGSATPDEPLDAETVKANNTVLITGRKENCEKAKEQLLALVPITITVDIPYEFHRFVIGSKGAGVRDLMERFNVNIRVPPSDQKSDTIAITGTSDAVQLAKAEMEAKLTEYEAEKANREARNFSISFTVDPKYHRKIIGKRGQVIMKIRQKFDVQINVPESKGGNVPENADQVTIIGYENNANQAKEEILKIVKDLEDLVSEELEIDQRIHPRLIGGGGKNIRRTMEQYKVDIRFPRSNQDEDFNPNLVVITGLPSAVAEAKEYLLETVDGFLDDIEVQYQPPQDHQFHINFEELSAAATVKDSGKGFSVRGGPWEKKSAKGSSATGGGHGNASLDTNSAQDFPAFGGGPGSAPNGNGLDSNGMEPSINGGSAWGPRKN